MNLHKLLLTKNECYIRGTPITPVGVMVHSTAVNNPWIKRYVGPDDGILGENTNGNHWNHFHVGGKDIGTHTFKADKNGRCVYCGGQQKCVHAFIGKLKDGTIGTYQTLPWNVQGWHAGGSANRKGYIGFEICEDGLTDLVYFNSVYREAVELTAYLCKRFGLDPQKDGVVICHSEGHKRGIASGHSDVMHWFPRHGKDMNDFRADVAKQIKKEKEEAEMTEQQIRSIVKEEWAKLGNDLRDIIRSTTRDEMDKMDKEKAGLPTSKWAVPFVQKAIDNGLMEAVTVDGKETIDRPRSNLTREEAATLADAILDAVVRHVEQKPPDGEN